MESKLSDFLLDKMSMTEIYQPVIIKELLNNNGKRTKTDLAVALARYDLSILEYYKKIVMRWPKDTLTKHGVIRYEKNSETFLLNSNFVDLDNSNKEIEICEKKIASWIYKKNNIERSPQVNTSIRYRVLKRSNGKCELCGISKSLRPIDIDHIVPQSFKNKNGKIEKDGVLIDVNSEENLQALCYKCNRAKRNTDDTDFRRTKKLVRDNIPDIIIKDGREPKVKTLKGNKLLLALNEKLIEEHSEYISESDRIKSVEELADMSEVIVSLAKLKGYSREDFLKVAEFKVLKNGAFDKGYFYEGDVTKIKKSKP